jgi:hypothetical protein
MTFGKIWQKKEITLRRPSQGSQPQKRKLGIFFDCPCIERIFDVVMES